MKKYYLNLTRGTVQEIQVVSVVTEREDEENWMLEPEDFYVDLDGRKYAKNRCFDDPRSAAMEGLRVNVDAINHAAKGIQSMQLHCMNFYKLLEMY